MGHKTESKKIVFANALEFDHLKLIKIFNEMERSKSSYLLNSGTSPLALQKSKLKAGNDNENDDNKI